MALRALRSLAPALVAAAVGTACDRSSSGTIPDVESSAGADWGKRTAPHWTSFETKTLRWARRHEAHDLFAVVGVDGTAAIAADFVGTTALGGEPRTSAGYNDVLLAVTAPDGAPRWVKSFGNARLQYPTGVAVTPGASVVVGVESQGALDFGGGLVDSGAGEHVVARFDAAGSFEWARPVDGRYDARIVATHDEAVLVTDGDCRVARWDKAGAPLWSRRFDLERGRHPSWTDPAQLAVAASTDGGAFAAGTFAKTLRLGEGEPALTSAGADDGFVARLDEKGRVRWARRLGGAGDQAVHALAPLPDGGAVFAGDWDGGFDGTLEGSTPTSSGASGASRGPALAPASSSALPSAANASSGHGIFVVALDSRGARLWARVFPQNDGTATVRGVAVDAAGRVAVAGDFDGALDVGRALRALGARDMFLVRLGRDGTFVSARRFGDDWPQRGAAVSVDAAGNALVVGAQPVDHAGDTSDSDWFVVSVP